MMNRLPEIGGRRLDVSLTEFEHSCLVRIGEMLEDPNLDTGLISLLSNAVRLARECSDIGLPCIKIDCQCEVYQTCDICRSDTEADLARARARDRTVVP